MVCLCFLSFPFPLTGHDETYISAVLLRIAPDGDLNNLLKRADCKQQRVKSQIKEIKGLGDLGTDLFINNVQAVWPCLAPFLDSRSLKTAEEVGIGTDLEAIYAELGHDPVEMSKLALGLSNVRLEKKQGKIEEEG